MRTSLLALLLISLVGVASAKPWWMRGVESNASDFLPPDVAFRASARVDGNVVRVPLDHRRCYYLYRRRNRDQGRKSGSRDLRPRCCPRRAQVRFPISALRKSISSKWKPRCPTPASMPAPIPANQSDLSRLRRKRASATHPSARCCFPSRRRPLAAWSPRQFLDGCGHPRRRLRLFLAGLSLRKGRKLDLPAA